MLDLQALFAERVLANVTSAKDAKNMTDIALINALAERGVFSEDTSAENIERIKENKRNLYNDWRSGKSKTFLKYIEAIADILDTDVLTLSGLETKKSPPPAPKRPEKLTEQEEEIISAYRSLDLEGQTRFLRCLVEICRKT